MTAESHKKDIDWNGTERRSEIMASYELQVAELTLIKKAVASVVGVLVLQLVAAIWWAATLTANLEYMKIDISAMKIAITDAYKDRYRVDDAVKDRLEYEKRMDRLQVQVDLHTRAIYELGGQKLMKKEQ